MEQHHTSAAILFLPFLVLCSLVEQIDSRQIYGCQVALLEALQSGCGEAVLWLVLSFIVTLTLQACPGWVRSGTEQLEAWSSFWSLVSSFLLTQGSLWCCQGLIAVVLALGKGLLQSPDDTFYPGLI